MTIGIYIEFYPNSSGPALGAPGHFHYIAIDYIAIDEFFMPPLHVIDGGNVDAAHPARLPETPSSSCRCNIGGMPTKVPAKCAIPGCHRRIKLTLAEREELRRVGRENNATAGVVCTAHVRAAFNFEFDDIDIDVPLEELLVEASKETPRWRVMLTPLPGAEGEPDGQPTPGRGDRIN